MGDNGAQVKVAVRVRPINGRETDLGDKAVLYKVSHEPAVTVSGKVFTFDNVFAQQSRQEDIYRTCVTPLVDGIFQGINGTVFAYGQTGSGKTFTMGSEFEPENESEGEGVIPRAIRAVVARAEALADRAEVTLRVSFLEIYNEEVKDLLNPDSELTPTVREDKSGAILVANLSERVVDSVHGMCAALVDGSRARATARTGMNAHSSRSHAVYTISVDCKPRRGDDSSGGDGNGDGEEGGEIALTHCAKLHLVDLAGSERAKKTHAEGTRLREGININSGLLSLGKVISALGDERNRGRNVHVPYRESKLTRLLQDALGGNSRTVMIACVSPAGSNAEESQSTLRYAYQAKNIRNKPVVNRDPRDEELLRLRQLVRCLQSGQDPSAVPGSGAMLGAGAGVVAREALEEAEARARAAEEEIASLRAQLRAAQSAAQEEAEAAFEATAARDRYRAALEAAGVDCPTSANDGSASESMSESHARELASLRAQLRRAREEHELLVASSELGAGSAVREVAALRSMVGSVGDEEIQLVLQRMGMGVGVGGMEEEEDEEDGQHEQRQAGIEEEEDEEEGSERDHDDSGESDHDEEEEEEEDEEGGEDDPEEGERVSKAAAAEAAKHEKARETLREAEAAHSKKQAALDERMADLLTAIREKEQSAAKQQSEEALRKMRLEHEAHMRALEAEMQRVETEARSLRATLSEVQQPQQQQQQQQRSAQNGGNSKRAAQLQQRIKQLEQRLGTMKRDRDQQAAALRRYRESETAARKQAEEIANLRKQRVELQRKAETEVKSFRDLKRKHEQRIRAAERKMRQQAVRLQRLSQQNSQSQKQLARERERITKLLQDARRRDDAAQRKRDDVRRRRDDLMRARAARAKTRGPASGSGSGAGGRGADNGGTAVLAQGRPLRPSLRALSSFLDRSVRRYVRDFHALSAIAAVQTERESAQARLRRAEASAAHCRNETRAAVVAASKSRLDASATAGNGNGNGNGNDGDLAASSGDTRVAAARKEQSARAEVLDARTHLAQCEARLAAAERGPGRDALIAMAAACGRGDEAEAALDTPLPTAFPASAAEDESAKLPFLATDAAGLSLALACSPRGVQQRLERDGLLAGTQSWAKVKNMCEARFAVAWLLSRLVSLASSSSSSSSSSSLPSPVSSSSFPAPAATATASPPAPVPATVKKGVSSWAHAGHGTGEGPTGRTKSMPALPRVAAAHSDAASAAAAGPSTGRERASSASDQGLGFGTVPTEALDKPLPEPTGALAERRASRAHMLALRPRDRIIAHTAASSAKVRAYDPALVVEEDDDDDEGVGVGDGGSRTAAAAAAVHADGTGHAVASTDGAGGVPRRTGVASRAGGVTRTTAASRARQRSNTTSISSGSSSGGNGNNGNGGNNGGGVQAAQRRSKKGRVRGKAATPRGARRAATAGRRVRRARLAAASTFAGMQARGEGDSESEWTGDESEAHTDSEVEPTPLKQSRRSATAKPQQQQQRGKGTKRSRGRSSASDAPSAHGGGVEEEEEEGAVSRGDGDEVGADAVEIEFTRDAPPDSAKRPRRAVGDVPLGEVAAALRGSGSEYAAPETPGPTRVTMSLAAMALSPAETPGKAMPSIEELRVDLADGSDQRNALTPVKPGDVNRDGGRGSANAAGKQPAQAAAQAHHQGKHQAL